MRGTNLESKWIRRGVRSTVNSPRSAIQACETKELNFSEENSSYSILWNKETNRINSFKRSESAFVTHPLKKTFEEVFNKLLKFIFLLTLHQRYRRVKQNEFY